MKLKKIIKSLNEWAPAELAEDFDNVGLLLGNAEQDVQKILVAFDVTPQVVEEAIEEQADLIVCFHPLIFKGLKKLNAAEPTAAMLMKLIKNDIAVFALHTNLDQTENGPNKEICRRLGIENSEVLIPAEQFLYKLIFFVPEAQAEEVKSAIFAAGAGQLGNYSHCSFSSTGTGSFRAEAGAEPAVGEINQIHLEKEMRVEVLVKKNHLKEVIAAMKEKHPYEEVAYDVLLLENQSNQLGMGRVGNLVEPMNGELFLEHVKKVFNLKMLRHSTPLPLNVRRVAVLGGSGAFAIVAAQRQGAQAFISADFKYHDFFKGLENFMICDVGHYESEQWNKLIIKNYLSEKFPNFAVRISRINTNSVNYY